MRKVLNKILVTAILLTTFTLPISANTSNRTSTEYFQGKAFYVESLIYTDQESSRSATNYAGTNVQIYVKNTSLYANDLQKSSTNIGYDGGVLYAYASVSSSYDIYSCNTYGNVKNANGDIKANSVTVEIRD